MSAGLRKFLENAFHAEVINFYGASESLALGVEQWADDGMIKQGLMLLQRQRKALLDGIHKDQSCIEYLDGVMAGMRKGDT